MEIASATALWYHAGKVPVAIGGALIRDPASRFQPLALLSTDTDLEAEQSVAAFGRRWSMETTFQEAHAQLGLEKASARGATWPSAAPPRCAPGPSSPWAHPGGPSRRR